MSSEAQHVNEELKKLKKGFMAQAADGALGFFDGSRGFNTASTTMATAASVFTSDPTTQAVTALATGATDFTMNKFLSDDGKNDFHSRLGKVRGGTQAVIGLTILAAHLIMLTGVTGSPEPLLYLQACLSLLSKALATTNGAAYGVNASLNQP